LAKVPSPIVRPTSYLPTFLITIFFTSHAHLLSSNQTDSHFLRNN
jgi:hypothetical protein